MWTHSVLFCLVALAICPASEVKMSGRLVSEDGSGPCPAARFGPNLPGLPDTLWSFACPGTFPTGLTWDGAHFWHTDVDMRQLYRLSPTGVVETTFGLPSSASGHGDLAWDGAHLWMVDETQTLAYQLDTATGNALRSITLPDTAGSHAWGITWDGQYLWQSSYLGPGQIFQIDTVSGAVISQFTPPRTTILGIVWDGAYLWGVDIDARVAYKMSVPSGTVVDSFNWQLTYPLGMAWDGQYLWNVSGSEGSGGTRRVYKLGEGTGLFEGPTTVAPRSALLSRPEPNPFTNQTRLSCNAGSASVAGVEVFDTQGRLVRHLAPDSRNVLTWDGIDDAGRQAAPGVHFFRLRLSDGTVEQRPVLLVL